jgi:hypothetical protein
LAVGLLIFAVMACSSSNTSSGPISEGYMAKDNNGEPGDQTNTFAPGDRTVHCQIKLSEAKEGTRIKFAWSIVEAGDTKNEKIKDIEYTTGAKENIVHGHLTAPRDWPTGKYKCEVFVNDKSEKTIDYYVK